LNVLKFRQPDKEVEIIAVKTTEERTQVTTVKTVPDDTTTIPTTSGPTSCAANTGIYVSEPEAFAFGDEDTSLIQINVSKKKIQRKYVPLTLFYATFSVFSKSEAVFVTLFLCIVGT
jgi:hypothetical protein